MGSPLYDVVVRSGMHLLTRTHRVLDAGSRGRFGHSLVLLAPSVWLTTTGRRSGRSRRVPLVAARDGDAYLVAGSAGGSERTPDWVFNLRGHVERGEPAVVEDRGRRHEVDVAELTGPERDAGFARMVGAYRGFAGYERHARRTIPVFRLVPTGPR